MMVMLARKTVTRVYAARRDLCCFQVVLEWLQAGSDPVSLYKMCKKPAFLVQ